MPNLLLYLTEISLLIIALVCCVVLFRWHNSSTNTFDLTDVLVGPDGKASLYKIGQAAALLVSTWAFVIMVQRDKLTEFYFYGYMGIWSGINLIKNILNKPAEQEQK